MCEISYTESKERLDLSDWDFKCIGGNVLLAPNGVWKDLNLLSLLISLMMVFDSSKLITQSLG